jgi:hypothetical protein
MLTSEQTETLRAAVDRIIPPDDFPGGAEAGALTYLLQQLNRDLAPYRDEYTAFLDELDAAAKREHSGAAFAQLPPDAQDILLRTFEASAWKGPFFRRFVEHAQEGFYTSPDSWDMIGWKVKG